MRTNLGTTKSTNHTARQSATHGVRYLTLSIFSLIFTLVCVGSAAADQGAFYLSKWGSYGTGTAQFSSPSGVAIDAGGYIYVVDRGNNRVVKHSPDRTEADVVWGGSGSGPGQFNSPEGIAIDSSGNVFVADSGNNRIQWFNSSGSFITNWGSLGTTNGRFNKPFGVAVNGRYIYVTDYENNRVQEFQYASDFTVNFVAGWGGPGKLSLFNHPNGIAVDGSGNVYVADTENHRIQKLIPGQVSPEHWGSFGQNDGEFSYPSGVAVDGNGVVYVVDRGNNRCQKFTNGGYFIGKWGSFGTTGNSQFYFPTSMAVNGCSIVVTDTSNNRVQKFTCDNSNFNAQWGSAGTNAGQFNFGGAGPEGSPNGIAVDSKGFVYVADVGNNRIGKFSPTGDSIWQIHGSDSGSGTFDHPVDVAVDSADNVYVADSLKGRIQKFSSSGTYLTQWNTSYSVPLRIAIDGSDGVYVVVYPLQILKYNSVGAGGYPILPDPYTDPLGNYQPLDPHAVAASATNSDVTIYVASGSTYPNKIVRFNSPNVGYPSQLSAASLAVDRSGIVYALDDQANLIRKLTSSCVVLTQWGTGAGNGEFGHSGIAVDRNGNIYVVDVPNNRIRKFSTLPSVVINFP